MEMFDSLVDSMHISDSEKKVIITAKKDIEDMIYEEDYIYVRRSCEDLIQAIK